MNVMRVNFSHATRDEFHLRRNNLRDNPDGQNVAVMLDTKGPEIRMGGLKVCKETGNRKAKMSLVAGNALTLTNDKAYDGASDESMLYVDYQRLAEVVSVGDRVLLDDGLVSLRVTGVGKDGTVATEVLNSSEIGERKGINLPGVKTGLPAMSDKDKEDIKFGLAHDIDMVAASFVRSAEGVHEIRDYMRQCVAELQAEYAKSGAAGLADPRAADDDQKSGATVGYHNEGVPLPLIISKIESTEALEELPEIIEASDGIMVARGDLGVEVPIQQVATYQKDMVEMCLAMGKPVITATQMLESMQKNPRPTRAEVADVTNAVIDGCDAVMLSGESANGQYPVESIETQAAIVTNAEEWAYERNLKPSVIAEAHGGDAPGGPDETFDQDDAMSAAACLLAERVGAAAIIVEETGFGDLSRCVAKHRPSMPIAAVCDDLKVARQLAVSRGIHAAFVHAESEIDDTEVAAFVHQSTGLLEPGETAVILRSDEMSMRPSIELETFMA